MVPALVPALHGPRSTGDCMASSERSEAVSSGMWSILEEDVVLGICAEVCHGCVASAAVAFSVAEHAGGLAAAKCDFARARLPHNRKNRSTVQSSAYRSRARSDDYMLNWTCSACCCSWRKCLDICVGNIFGRHSMLFELT